MEKKSRHTRTVEDKLKIVKFADAHSKHAAARTFGCAPKSIRDWKAQEEELKASIKKREKRTLHKGKKTSSTYAEIEERLYEWIIDKRSKGKIVTTSVVIARMRIMKPELKEKTDNALQCYLRRFMRRRYLAYRKPTHVGQSLPENYLKKIEDFRIAFRSLKDTYGVSESRVVNMDEVPIYYENSSGRVISIKGSKTVTLTQSQAGQTRITLVLGVGSDGLKIPPLLIFKGEFGKTLQKIPVVHQKKVYAICDKTAWNNSEAMDYWLQNVWNDLSRNMQNNILVMDDYSVHKTLSVTNKLRACRTYPCLIPGGMTRLLQPLDVGVNHIVKQELRNIFALTSVENEEKPTLDQLRVNIINWVDTVWNSPESKVTPEKIKNCFTKCGVYSVEEEKEPVPEEKSEEGEEGAKEEDKEDSASIDPVDAFQDVFANEDEEGEDLSGPGSERESGSESGSQEGSRKGSSENSVSEGREISASESHEENKSEMQEECGSESMVDIPSSETPPNP